MAKKAFENPFGKGRSNPSANDLMNIMLGSDTPNKVTITTTAENAIIKDESTGDLQLGQLKITAVGIDVGKDATVDDYEKLVDFVTHIHGAYQWIIADTVLLGEHFQWGETYQNMMESFGKEYQTFANWATTARRWPFHRRRRNLSFTHHQLLNAIESDQMQDDWLDWCEQNNASSSALRKALTEIRDSTNPAKKGTIDKKFIDAYKAINPKRIVKFITSDPKSALNTVAAARAYLDEIEAAALQEIHKNG